MTNKLDNLLKALNNQVLSPPHKDARTNSGPQVKDPSSSKQVHFINVVTIKPIERSEDSSKPKDEVKEDEVDKEIRENESKEVEKEEDYFNRLPTREERAYHKDDDAETG